MVVMEIFIHINNITKDCFGVLLLVYESKCLHNGPGTKGEMPTVEVFLRDPSPYLHGFWRKTTENSEWLGW